jgi:hypothetical protein
MYCHSTLYSLSYRQTRYVTKYEDDAGCVSRTVRPCHCICSESGISTVVAFKRVCRKEAALQETPTMRHQIVQQKGETGQTVVLVKTCYFCLIQFSMWNIFKEIHKEVRPPLWSSGQSSWLQIRRPGFDSRHYQNKK